MLLPRPRSSVVHERIVMVPPDQKPKPKPNTPKPKPTPPGKPTPRPYEESN